MKSVGAFSAKTHLSSLLEKVERGEHVVITKHRRPIAKLVPIQGMDQNQHLQAINRLKTLSKQRTLGKVNWKDLRDEGRR